MRYFIYLSRNKEPTAGIIDSQTVKTTERGGVKGYDGVKKIKGRKRHILVDTEGFSLANKVTEANCGDRVGLHQVLENVKGSYKLLKKCGLIWAILEKNAAIISRKLS